MVHAIVNRTCAACLLALLGAAGCVNVDARPDYDRTAALIRGQTDQPETYLPGADEATLRAAVAAMLQDGVTADEAVRIALLHNPKLQSLFYEVGVSRADVVQAGLPSNPSAGISVQFPSVRAIDGVGLLTKISASVSQNIVDLLLIPIRKKIAETQLEQTQLTVANQAVELIGDVKRTYYQLLGLQKAEAILTEDLELARRSVSLAQRRQEAGEASKIDVDLARADALDVERQRLEVRRDSEVLQARLAGLLGVSRWEGTWRLTDELPPPASLADAKTLWETAARQRLDLRVARLRIGVAEQQVALEQWSVIPNIDIGAEGERAEAPPNFVGPTVGATLPLWHQNQAQIARMRMVADGQKRQYEAALDTAAEDVRRAIAAALANAQLVRFYNEQTLPLGRENVESTRRAYEGGQADILRLTQAQRFLIAQQRTYVAVLRDYAVALADLEQAVGGRIQGDAPSAPPPQTSPEGTPGSAPRPQ